MFQASSEPSMHKESMTDSSTWNIVIVDDEPDSIGVAEYVLQFHGAKVRTALNGISGLDLLHQERPTALLLDIQMLKMSGWDVLKAIRQDGQLKGLPVIALTAFAMSGDKERILAAGFDGYLSKPISPMTFISEMDALLNSRSLL
jgi:CheY-like chemotaxis protein